jgi:hypothetical protein
MSFKDELNAEVNSVRDKIKTEAINHFINVLKEAMKNTARKGLTNGSISLRINFEECEHYHSEDEDCAEDHTGDLELYRLDELLLLTKERESGALGMYEWLIKQVNKTGIFKEIYINLNTERYELDFFWDIE